MRKRVKLLRKGKDRVMLSELACTSYIYKRYLPPYYTFLLFHDALFDSATSSQ